MSILSLAKLSRDICVSRIVTKVFLGHFGYVKDIFNNFRAPKVIFVKIWSF